MRDNTGDPDEAFVNALSEQLGGLVTQFVVVASYIDSDGDTRLFSDTMRNQRVHTTMGLLAWAQAVENRRASDTWASDE